MSKYDEAKKIAEKLVELELTRKTVTQELKAGKDELLDLIHNNEIESMFEFNNGVVFVETSTKYEIADGLKEETEVKSKSPEKLSQDFVDSYFATDLKLNKRAKKRLEKKMQIYYLFSANSKG